jgi:hypothetical protein
VSATKLLDRAKAHLTTRRGTSPVTDDEIDLALAWLRAEVTTTQAAAALYGEARTASNHAVAQSRLARVLREAYTRGRLTVKERA